MTFVLTSEPNGSAISKRTEYAIRNLKKHECRYRLINLGTEEGAEWDKKVKEWERSVLGEKWFEDWNDLNKQEIKWKEISQNCQQCEWSKTEDGGIKPTRTCETCKISGVPLKKKRHEMELEKRNLTIERRPLFANAEKTLIGSILDFEIALENEQSGLAAFLGCATQEAILGRMKLLQDAINNDNAANYQVDLILRDMLVPMREPFYDASWHLQKLVTLLKQYRHIIINVNVDELNKTLINIHYHLDQAHLALREVYIYLNTCNEHINGQIEVLIQTQNKADSSRIQEAFRAKTALQRSFKKVVKRLEKQHKDSCLCEQQLENFVHCLIYDDVRLRQQRELQIKLVDFITALQEGLQHFEDCFIYTGEAKKAADHTLNFNFIHIIIIVRRLLKLMGSEKSETEILGDIYQEIDLKSLRVATKTLSNIHLEAQKSGQSLAKLTPKYLNKKKVITLQENTKNSYGKEQIVSPAPGIVAERKTEIEVKIKKESEPLPNYKSPLKRRAEPEKDAPSVEKRKANDIAPSVTLRSYPDQSKPSKAQTTENLNSTDIVKTGNLKEERESSESEATIGKNGAKPNQSSSKIKASARSKKNCLQQKKKHNQKFESEISADARTPDNSKSCISLKMETVGECKSATLRSSLKRSGELENQATTPGKRKHMDTISMSSDLGYETASLLSTSLISLYKPSESNIAGVQSDTIETLKENRKTVEAYPIGNQIEPDVLVSLNGIVAARKDELKQRASAHVQVQAEKLSEVTGIVSERQEQLKLQTAKNQASNKLSQKLKKGANSNSGTLQQIKKAVKIVWTSRDKSAHQYDTFSSCQKKRFTEISKNNNNKLNPPAISFKATVQTSSSQRTVKEETDMKSLKEREASHKEPEGSTLSYAHGAIRTPEVTGDNTSHNKTAKSRDKQEPSLHGNTMSKKRLYEQKIGKESEKLATSASNHPIRANYKAAQENILKEPVILTRKISQCRNNPITTPVQKLPLSKRNDISQPCSGIIRHSLQRKPSSCASKGITKVLENVVQIAASFALPETDQTLNFYKFSLDHKEAVRTKESNIAKQKEIYNKKSFGSSTTNGQSGHHGLPKRKDQESASSPPSNLSSYNAPDGNAPTSTSFKEIPNKIKAQKASSSMIAQYRQQSALSSLSGDSRTSNNIHRFTTPADDKVTMTTRKRTASFNKAINDGKELKELEEPTDKGNNQKKNMPNHKLWRI